MIFVNGGVVSIGPVGFGTFGVEVKINGGKVDVDVGGSLGVDVSIWGGNVVDVVRGSLGVVVSMWGGNVGVGRLGVVVFEWGGNVGVVLVGTLGVVDFFGGRGDIIETASLNNLINWGRVKPSTLLWVLNVGFVEFPSLFFDGFVELPSLFFVRKGNVKLKSKWNGGNIVEVSNPKSKSKSKSPLVNVIFG